MPVSIGRAIRLIRNSQDLTSAELAKRALVSKPYLSLVESGLRSPSIDVIKRLAASLGVPAELFIVIATGQGGELTATPPVNRLLEIFGKLNTIERELRQAVGEPEPQPTPGRDGGS